MTTQTRFQIPTYHIILTTANLPPYCFASLFGCLLASFSSCTAALSYRTVINAALIEGEERLV